MAYRVLSLDGGGPWAVIQVKALMDLFGSDASGWDVLRQFDLVAANSAGSIVLGCLVENLPLTDIFNKLFLNQDVLLSIFAKTSSVGDKILEGLAHIGPKYSEEKKLPALQTALPGQGNKTLGDAVGGVLCHSGTGLPVHLLIVGFDYDRCTAKFFRSAPAKAAAYGTGASTTLTLAEAIHASTNAPVNYFDGPAVYPDNPGRYWDGGIAGFNNPVLAGVTEAIALGNEPTNVIALSLGTATVAKPWPQPGEEASPYVLQPSDTGLLNDLGKLAGSILDDPPDLATFVAHVLTGGTAGVPAAAGSRVVRMNPLVSPMRDPASGQWTAPANFALAQFLAFAKIPMDAIEPGNVAAIAAYADKWIADATYNQPIRMDGDTLTCELGQMKYSAAKAAWNALCAPPPAPAPAPAPDAAAAPAAAPAIAPAPAG
jgi:hypothetical protein